MGRRPHLDPESGDGARLERLGRGVRFAMSEVQDSGAHLEWRPVRSDVLESNDRRRDRHRRLPGEHDRRHADDVHISLDGFRGEGRDERVVRTEVAGDAVRPAAGSP